MKCNKCCNKIPQDEEIRDDKKYYCETCWKSDSWKRTASSIMLWSLCLVVALLLLAVAFAICWETKKGED